MTWTGASGCLGGQKPAPPDCSDAGGPVTVSIGVTALMTGAYVALNGGDTIQLETFGQGGNHAPIALQIDGLGNSAFVEVSIEDLDGTGRVQTAPFARAQPLLCDEEQTCHVLNILVRTGGLTDPDSLDGLPVRVTARAHDGGCQHGTAEVTALLAAP